jgi:hypothetical protein
MSQIAITDCRNRALKVTGKGVDEALPLVNVTPWRYC